MKLNTTSQSKFYRIQNVAGHGPYHSNSLFRAGFSIDKYTGDRHPAPSRDSELTSNFKDRYDRNTGDFADLKPFIFGFCSIEQLRAWFFDNEVLAYLHSEGFSLWESSCEIVAGNSQALASKSAFEFSDKKEISLLSLLETK